MTALDGLNVAIVHDYLNQRGGAERVVLELSDMWPNAPIYTSLYRPNSTFPEFRDREVRLSPLDRIPVDRAFRSLFPLYPAAFSALGEIQADLVVASSSGWAHMFRSSPDALRVVYCHTPARWLYGGQHLSPNTRSAVQQGLARSIFSSLRRLDRAAARRTNLYVANSHGVRRRIMNTYGIGAPVVPPPVDVDRFHPSPRGERLLVVSRLLPYKHVDIVIRAANRAGFGLDVVGDGPLRSALAAIAGPTVTLHGSVDDQTVVELIQKCRAVCVAGEEDFGIVSVEAQAAGKPVIAFAGGGALETVQHGLTGFLFHERTPENVVEALRAADSLDTQPERIAECVRCFSREGFRRRLSAVINRAFELRDRGSFSGGRGSRILPTWGGSSCGPHRVAPHAVLPRRASGAARVTPSEWRTYAQIPSFALTSPPRLCGRHVVPGGESHV